jgi:hypothetical protein
MKVRTYSLSDGRALHVTVEDGMDMWSVWLTDDPQSQVTGFPLEGVLAEVIGLNPAHDDIPGELIQLAERIHSDTPAENLPAGGRLDSPIAFDSDGFWYTTATGAFRHFPWIEIIEIRAHNGNLVTSFEVRFLFQMSGWSAEVGEEQPGFREFTKQLEIRFPSVVGWEERVKKPAFARNNVVLFRRNA